MICEFRNTLERYIAYCLDINPNEFTTKETYLSNVIITIICAILVTIFVTWWSIPLRVINKIIRNLNLNRKFVCSKYKEE